MAISAFYIKAQADTIYTKERVIPCRIIEISDGFIRYQLPNSQASPVFVIKRKNTLAYKLASDNLRVNNPETSDYRLRQMRNTQLIVKLNLFGFYKNCISLGFEQIVARNWSTETEVGFMTSALGSKYHSIGLFPYLSSDYEGYYLRPSIKCFYTKPKNKNNSLSYYLRLDGTYATIRHKEIESSLGLKTDGSSSVVINATALTLNFGTQYLIKNKVSIEFFLGSGVSGITSKLDIAASYPKHLIPSLNASINNNYNAFPSLRRVSSSGLIYSFGWRLGFKINDK